MSTLQKHEEHTIDLDSKRDLIKSVFFKGCSNDEVELFLHVCKKTGLDPMMKQIYPVKRWSSAEKKEVMTCQTSIDGFRLIAERTGRYCPGKEATHIYNKEGELVSATTYVKKMTMDGTWHEVAATAFYDEYVQKTKEGKVTQFWERMPHVMLAKCAESLALRKAFPADLSGLYTSEEMSQSSTPTAQSAVVHVEQASSLISSAQAEEMESLLQGRSDLKKKLMDWAAIETISDLPMSKYQGAIKAIENHIKQEGA